jgi:hypothetical protein
VLHLTLPAARRLVAIATCVVGWAATTSAAHPAQERHASAAEPSALQLTIANVEIQSGPFIDLSPTTDVTFELTNRAATAYRNVVLEVSMVSGTGAAERDQAPLVLAGPVAIRSTFELQPGFTMLYQMRLRNFSNDCDCHATVKVVSAVAVEKR